MITELALLIVLAILCAALLLQQWFWSRQTQKLIDKLMSKNYAEYVQVNTPPRVPSGQTQRLDISEAMEAMTEANSYLRGTLP